MPRPLEPAVPPPAVDASEFLGVYERESVRIDVLERDGKLRMRQTVTGPLAELVPETTTEDELVPVGPAQFAFSPAGMRGWISVTFYALPTGERYLHSGVRATPKVKE
jgi:hypothetical protein